MKCGSCDKKKIYAIKVGRYIVLTYSITKIGLKNAIEDHKRTLARHYIEQHNNTTGQ